MLSFLTDHAHQGNVKSFAQINFALASREPVGIKVILCRVSVTLNKITLRVHGGITVKT